MFSCSCFLELVFCVFLLCIVFYNFFQTFLSFIFFVEPTFSKQFVVLFQTRFFKFFLAGVATFFKLIFFFKITLFSFIQYFLSSIFFNHSFSVFVVISFDCPFFKSNRRFLSFSRIFYYSFFLNKCRHIKLVSRSPTIGFFHWVILCGFDVTSLTFKIYRRKNKILVVTMSKKLHIN